MSRKNTGGQNVLKQAQWISHSRLPLLHLSQAPVLCVCVREGDRQPQVHPENTECSLRNKFWCFPSYTHQRVSTIHIFFSWATLWKRKGNWTCSPCLLWGSSYKKSGASLKGQICLMYFTVYIINVLPEEQNFKFHKGSGDIFVPKYERETDIHNDQASH